MTDTTKIGAWSVAGVAFPPLSADLIEKSASAMFAAMEEMDGNGATRTPWANVTDGVRECWRLIAKKGYAAMAIEAGAKPEGIGR